MTECERLIENGTFSPDFFRSEVRCDFLVTEKRKKIWAVELDLLRHFDAVCKKHGLKYFAFVGTLLGAVRHRGFVPWDDDIDLAMPRDDYEKMLMLGGEFSHPYFLQSPWTDANYFYSFAKLRNSQTSCISEMFKYRNFNHGIPLDFHPIDVWVPEENGERVYNAINQLAYDNSTYMRMSNPHLSEQDLKRVGAFHGIDPLLACEKMRTLGMTYHGRESKYVCRNTIGVYGYKRNLFMAEDFADTIEWPFEGMSIPVPTGYDRILKTLYGDYMDLPPVEKRGAWHSGAVFDADIPWKTKLDEMSREDRKEASK